MKKQPFPIGMILVLLFCFCSGECHSQSWDSSDHIDTLLGERGELQYLENVEKGESLNYDYDKEGRLKSVSFDTQKNGIQYEKVTHYHPNGKISDISFYYIVDKKFYGMPVSDSITTEYDEEGRKTREWHYQKGKAEVIKWYYSNGKVEEIRNYTNGRLAGIQCFDEQGNSLFTGELINGTGELIMYEDGIQVSICRFKNGRMLRRTCRCN